MSYSLSSPGQEKVTSLFNQHGVEYLAAGDFALSKYSEGRYFNHLTLWVNPTPENFNKLSGLYQSINRKLSVDPKAFTTPNALAPLLTIGGERKGVELFTALPGIDPLKFNETKAKGRSYQVGETPTTVLHEQDLLRTIRLGNHPNRAVDALLLERSLPSQKTTQTLNPGSLPASAVDWREAARTMDPHRVLTDLGFRLQAEKGRINSSASQTYKREGERITVYPNPHSKPLFIDHGNGRKGDAVDLLNWQFNFDPKQVNAFIRDHFGGLAPGPLLGVTPPKKEAPVKREVVDEAAYARMRTKELREKYNLQPSLSKPAYLESRGLTPQTLYRPEFFGQILSANGWNEKEQKRVAVENTAFPLRSDYGTRSLILRNPQIKLAAAGERGEGIWLSNLPVRLSRPVRIRQGEKELLLPKGTEGTLLGNPIKPDTVSFYFTDPNKSGKELPYNKTSFSGKGLEGLLSALEPVKVDRLVITENPIDNLAFHQLYPPKPGESRLYASTGGNPSGPQLSYLNRLVERLAPSQIVLGNDNDQKGREFNVTMMGALSHPGIQATRGLLAKVSQTPGPEASRQYELTLQGARGVPAMEAVALSFTEALNRLSPKGGYPPAQLTYLNGTPEGVSEARITFPKNAQFLAVAQSHLEKTLNGLAGGEAFNIVQAQTKDFTQDLTLKGDQKRELGPVPKLGRNSSASLLEQLKSPVGKGLEALFGVPAGTMSGVESSQRQSHQVEQTRQLPPSKEREGVSTEKRVSEGNSIERPAPKLVLRPKL